MGKLFGRCCQDAVYREVQVARVQAKEEIGRHVLQSNRQVSAST